MAKVGDGHKDYTGTGAPTVDPDLVGERFAELLGEGMSVAGACKLEGFSRNTFYRWLKMGDEGHETYAKFARRIHEAQGTLKRELLSSIKRGTTADKRWMMERLFPREYGKAPPQIFVQQQQHVGGDSAKTLTAMVAPVELTAEIDRRLAAGKGHIIDVDEEAEEAHEDEDEEDHGTDRGADEG